MHAGIYGAKVQSWRARNPREILARIIEENPKASRGVILMKVSEELLQPHNAEMIDVVIEYWFSNNYASLLATRSTSSENIQQRREKRSESIRSAKQKISKGIDAIVKIRLLEMIMPNGKPLKECTFAECAEFGNWATRLSAKGNPHEKIGVILNEEDVRAAWAE